MNEAAKWPVSELGGGTGAPDSSRWAATPWSMSSGPTRAERSTSAAGFRRLEPFGINPLEEESVLFLLFCLFPTQPGPFTSLKGITVNLLLAHSQGMFRMHLKKSTIKVFRGHYMVHKDGLGQQKPLLCVHTAQHRYSTCRDHIPHCNVRIKDVQKERGGWVTSDAISSSSIIWARRGIKSLCVAHAQAVGLSQEAWK